MKHFDTVSATNEGNGAKPCQASATTAKYLEFRLPLAQVIDSALINSGPVT
jgi:hypothetical protein